MDQAGSTIKPSALLHLCAVMGALALAACGQATVQTPEPANATSRPQAAQLGPTSTASATIPAQSTLPATATLAPIPTTNGAERLAGPASAPVKLLLYSDFDCGLCAQAYELIEAVMRRHPEQVTYYFRLYPLLGVHEKSAQAAAGFISAQRAGKAIDMHNLLFSEQAQWAEMTPAEFRQWLLEKAAELGLDQDDFADGMNAPMTLTAIQDAFSQAQQSAVPGVPFLIINNQPFLLDWTEVNLEASIRLALLAEKQLPNAPEVKEPSELPVFGQFEFRQGIVKFQLFPQAAPVAVTNFVYLAERGWYSDTGIYQVRPGSFVMGGDPSGTGLGNAGYFFEVETDPAYRFEQPGIIALDNDGPASNSSRFLITLEPRLDLDGAYTIIGRVTEGLALLQDLPARDPLVDLLTPPGAILERISFDR